MTAKHTPGPWEVVYVHGWAIGVGTCAAECGSVTVFEMIGNTLTKDVQDKESHRRTCEAKARLIAAAPKLAKDLKALLGYLGRLNDASNEGGILLCDEVDQAITDLRDAGLETP